jgi:hypothetical protein
MGIYILSYICIVALITVICIVIEVIHDRKLKNKSVQYNDENHDLYMSIYLDLLSAKKSYYISQTLRHNIIKLYCIISNNLKYYNDDSSANVSFTHNIDNVISYLYNLIKYGTLNDANPEYESSVLSSVLFLLSYEKGKKNKKDTKQIPLKG